VRLDQRRFPRPKIPRTLPSVTLSLSSVKRQARVSYRTSLLYCHFVSIFQHHQKPLNTSLTHPHLAHTQAFNASQPRHLSTIVSPPLDPITLPQPLQYTPLSSRRAPDLAHTPRLTRSLTRPRRLQCCWKDGPIVLPCSHTPDLFLSLPFLGVAFSRTW